MKKTLFILWLCCSALLPVSAQELNCKVQINSDKIEGSNKELFNTLKQSIEEFLNTNKWTNLTFATQEKIDCSILIIVNSVADNVFSCEATIQASRPVFNTTYTTPLLNLRDQLFDFSYQQYDQLTYQQSTFQTNLTAILAYYVYLILGVDADSYQRLGGTPYFQACENIITMAQTASSLSDAEQKGWAFTRSAGIRTGRTRYVLINEWMDEAFKPYRNFFYEYHRMGLDEMQSNVGNSRARIATGLQALREINKARPSNSTVLCFLDAKNDELVNIFQGGTDSEKQEVYDLLMAIDPTRSSTYDHINDR